MKIQVNNFGGTTPGVASHLLPGNAATVCVNALRENGNLVPLKAPLQSAVLADIGALVKTIFRHGTKWLAWGTDVDVVRAPIANDALGRIIYTGDGKPKFTDAALALTAPPYPTASMDLSLPSPSGTIGVSTNRTATATVWSDSTIFSAEDIVYPGNDYAYRAGTDGTSGAESPDWPTVLGATVVDGSITWTCVMVVSTGARQWLANSAVPAGQLVEVGDYLLRATSLVDGTSGATAPENWPLGLGETVYDGNLTWTNQGEDLSGPAWAALTSYPIGAQIVVAGFAYKVTEIEGLSAGTTGATAPTPATTHLTAGMWLGRTVIDGTVSWYAERVVSSGARYLNDFRGKFVKAGDVYEVLFDGYLEGGGGHYLYHSYKVITSGVTAETFNSRSGIDYDRHSEYHFHVNTMTDGGAKLAPITFADNSHSIYYDLNRPTVVTRGWVASTAYINGVCIIVDGYVYGSRGGTSGVSRGPWPTTVGQTVVDGTITWECMWPERYHTAAGREASTYYAVGAIQTIDGFNYLAKTAGLTATATPDFPISPGLTVPDGGVLWECTLFTGLADQEDVVYLETYLRRYAEIDEESLPSPVSAMVTVQFALSQTVQLTGFNVPTGTSHGITHRRLYRLTQGGTSADYFFLTELPIATTDYLDATPSDKLDGDILQTAEWDGAPDDLAGLVIMPGGILAGFIAGGKEVCFSEPYQYHAWPFAYRITVEDTIVALGVFGNSLLVATQGTPYVISGSQPGLMSVDRLEVNEACLSKRGLVDLGSAIAYPSPNGLVVIGRGINKVVTAATHRISDWQALIPNTFVGFSHRGRYFAFYNNGTAGLLSIDLAGNVDFFAPIADAVRADQLTGEVWICQGLNILKFNAGAALALSWNSVPFISPYPRSLSVGQVRATTYPCTLSLKGDGATLHTQSVTSALPFRLPAKRALTHEFTVSGSVEVENVILADSMADLGRA